MSYRRDFPSYILSCMLLDHVTGLKITCHDQTVLGVIPDLMIRCLDSMQVNESSDWAGASPVASDYNTLSLDVIGSCDTVLSNHVVI